MGDNMKKLIILLFFTISLFSQQNGKAGYGGAGYGGGGGSIENKSFWSCDYDGSPEYVYRTYVVSDSFLNMNGYERTLLPQSTMKIAFTLAYNGRDSLNTFTSAVDTAAGSLRRWIFHQDLSNYKYYAQGFAIVRKGDVFFGRVICIRYIYIIHIC